MVELQFADFLLIAGDEVFHKLAKWRYMHGGKLTLPVVVRLPTGVVGGAGAEHSQSLEAMAMHVPGLKVAAAGDAGGRQGPAEDRRSATPTRCSSSSTRASTGRRARCRSRPTMPGAVRRPPGSPARARDLTVVATGLMVGRALEAAEQLAAERHRAWR